MKAALAEDAPGTAVSYYADVLPMLRQYGSRAAFRAVAAEADALARQISALLKRRLVEQEGGHETEQVVLLLRQLGESDEALLVRPLRVWSFGLGLVGRVLAGERA